MRERIYANPAPTAVPQGASSQDWKIAEEVRALLSADPKLGNAPMAAVVNNGVRHSARRREEQKGSPKVA
jgi:hypothetical protein